MKKTLFIFTTLLLVTLLTAGVSKAAFPVKISAVAVEVANPPAVTVTQDNAAPAGHEESVIHTKKRSIFSNVVSRIINPRKATAMPPIAYILLCIIALGWLAMGLNDNFAGYEWVLSLVLYILFYFPGLIYSLIMMGKYY